MPKMSAKDIIKLEPPAQIEVLKPGQSIKVLEEKPSVLPQKAIQEQLKASEGVNQYESIFKKERDKLILKSEEEEFVCFKRSKPREPQANAV